MCFRGGGGVCEKHLKVSNWNRGVGCMCQEGGWSQFKGGHIVQSLILDTDKCRQNSEEGEEGVLSLVQ